MKLYGHRYLWANKKYSPSIKLWLKNTPKCESNTFFLQIQNLARIRQFECEAASRPWLLRRSDVDGPYWFLEASSFLDFVTASWKLAQLAKAASRRVACDDAFRPRVHHFMRRPASLIKKSIDPLVKQENVIPAILFPAEAAHLREKNTNAKLRFPEKK